MLQTYHTWYILFLIYILVLGTGSCTAAEAVCCFVQQYTGRYSSSSTALPIWEQRRQGNNDSRHDQRPAHWPLIAAGKGNLTVGCTAGEEVHSSRVVHRVAAVVSRRYLLFRLQYLYVSCMYIGYNIYVVIRLPRHLVCFTFFPLIFGHQVYTRHTAVGEVQQRTNATTLSM